MLKSVFQVAVVLLIALGGGAGTAWLALESTRTIGSSEIGPWVTFPNEGTSDADPYARARSARLGTLALGNAEGIVITATQDSLRRPLLRECSYMIRGDMPPTRFFTLHLTDLERRPLPAPARFASALHSQSLVWRRNNPLRIMVSPHAHPDNWIATTGPGPMRIVLTLVDTPLFTESSVGETRLPVIMRTGCDA
ncbi:MAG: DUF1214 domain-containing protein [Nitratireductor sp.]|uniref:DUF1214 domain-containing protein n=1 Tax=Nitratireductor sp. TaxID=1872084 RepID=UPI002605B2C2|nr:DUF1214 domain-containing protein [Nitratireductor sp.]MCV0348807.1 DUF1214 domain-containing protein [Nitratireductor sp.]